MGGRNDRLAHLVGCLDNVLLVNGNQFEGDFDAQITPGHHDSVSHLQNGNQIVIALLVFNLGDDFNLRMAFLRQNLADGQHIIGPPHKTGCHKINVIGRAKAQVIIIFLGDERHGQLDIGHIDPLAGGNGAAVGNLTFKFILAVSLQYLQGQLAVIDQNPVIDADILIKLVAVDMEAGGCAGNIFLGHRDLIAGGKLNSIIFHLADPDLRALGIEHDADMPAVLFIDVADLLDIGQMAGMIAMGKVQAGDIHSGFGQRRHHLFTAGGRADRAYNFCSSHS